MYKIVKDNQDMINWIRENGSVFLNYVLEHEPPYSVDLIELYVKERYGE